MIPLLVATDVDGTLLRRDGRVSERSRRSLEAVRRCAVPLVLVTGRPPRWMAAVVEATGHRGMAICGNGAQVLDVATGAVLESRLLATEPALAFAQALRAAEPSTAFAVEGADGRFGHEPAYRPRWPAPDAMVGGVAELLAAGPVVKLLARHRELDADALLARAVAAAAQLPVTLTHSSVEGLLEVAGEGVTKATGLARLAAEQGIPASAVLAFGDMPNDVSMLRWAGHGVAMANGHPLAIAAADEVTASAEEDGVAAVLERFFAGSFGGPG
ncbi:MAG: HAD family hydrolase [Mycobacteriales bacterium]